MHYYFTSSTEKLKIKKTLLLYISFKTVLIFYLLKIIIVFKMNLGQRMYNIQVYIYMIDYNTFYV